jgi:hypothetical protein
LVSSDEVFLSAELKASKEKVGKEMKKMRNKGKNIFLCKSQEIQKPES